MSSTSRTPEWLLGAAALVLAAGALVVGSPQRRGELDVRALARAVETGSDRIDAVELARRIRDRPDGLRIVDLRGPEAFETFHVPLAERVALGRLPDAGFRKEAELVLVASEGSVAGQAWTLLRALGYEHVRVLRGGVGAWFEEVMAPILPDDATEDERARWPEVAELSRYFGGTPREGGGRVAGEALWGGDDETIARAVEEARRRGCGWGR